MGASQVALVVKNQPASAGDAGDASAGDAGDASAGDAGDAGDASAGDAGDVSSIPGLGRSPEGEGMATHCSIIAWTIPWTEDPGGLQSMGSHRVRHD